MKKTNNVILIIAVLLVFVLSMAVAILGTLLYKANNSNFDKQKEDQIQSHKDLIEIKNDKETFETNKENELSEDNISKENELKSKELDDTFKQNVNQKNNIISSDDVLWQEPQNLGDLGYLKIEMNEDYDFFELPSYYKVGHILAGNYKDYDIYLVDGGTYFQSMNWSLVVRMLKKGDEVVFLDGREKFDDYKFDLISNNLNKKNKKVFIDDSILIEDLIFPEEISIKGAILSEREYLDDFFQHDSYKILRKVSSSKFGDVWVTDREKADAIFANKEDKTPEDYKKYGIFELNGFYIKSPDSTIVKYNIKHNFVDNQKYKGNIKKLHITLDNGKIIDELYEFYPLGCGVGFFVYDKSSGIDIERDLKSIGKFDNGDIAYGYKNTEVKDFKDWYKNLYWQEDGSNKTPEEILNESPVIFWKDPFGRILAFYKAEFIQPAECGKPVIYLYPQAEMDINVKVSPTNGFTKTEPEYKSDGWIVSANPSGLLYNYTDNKYYNYLFWEGRSDVLKLSDGRGFVVSVNDLDKFFSNSLKKLGLNDKEIRDFKEFWLPRMKQDNKPYYKISFLSRWFIDKSAPLNITPKPDTIIRVLMDYEGLDRFISIEPQILSTPERNGFTVVEWGGILHH